MGYPSTVRSRGLSEDFDLRAAPAPAAVPCLEIRRVLMVVIIIYLSFYLPAGTVSRVIKNIWWKVGLRLPVEDQVLQRLHPADLLAVHIAPRRAVLRHPLPRPRPRPVPASACVGELCNRRFVIPRPLITPRLSPLELIASLVCGGGTM